MSKDAYFGVGLIGVALGWLFLILSSWGFSSCPFVVSYAVNFYCYSLPNYPSTYAALATLLGGTLLMFVLPSENIFIYKRTFLGSGISLLAIGFLYLLPLVSSLGSACTPGNPPLDYCIYNPLPYEYADLLMLFGGIVFLVLFGYVPSRMEKKQSALGQEIGPVPGKH